MAIILSPWSTGQGTREPKKPHGNGENVETLLGIASPKKAVNSIKMEDGSNKCMGVLGLSPFTGGYEV